MPGTRYEVGTVTATPGSRDIVGSGTAWLTYAAPKGVIEIFDTTGQTYGIAEVVTDLLLRTPTSAPYNGPGGTGLAYRIINDKETVNNAGEAFSPGGSPGPPGLVWIDDPWDNTGGTLYQVDDALEYGGTSWRCIREHQSPAIEPGTDPATWRVVAAEGQAGSDGAAATLIISETETVPPGTPAAFVEQPGSTPQARDYKAQVPQGEKGDTGGVSGGDVTGELILLNSVRLAGYDTLGAAHTLAVLNVNDEGVIGAPSIPLRLRGTTLFGEGPFQANLGVYLPNEQHVRGETPGGAYELLVGKNASNENLFGYYTSGSTWLGNVDGETVVRGLGYRLLDGNNSARHQIPVGSNLNYFYPGDPAAQFPSPGVYVPPSAHATSNRAAAAIGSWSLAQDVSGDGTTNYGMFHATTGYWAVIIRHDGGSDYSFFYQMNNQPVNTVGIFGIPVFDGANYMHRYSAADWLRTMALNNTPTSRRYADRRSQGTTTIQSDQYEFYDYINNGLGDRTYTVPGGAYNRNDQIKITKQREGGVLTVNFGGTITLPTGATTSVVTLDKPGAILLQIDNDAGTTALLLGNAV